jgi:hydroxymethylbilane synthase
MEIIKIGARGSKLSLKQVEEIINKLRELGFEYMTFEIKTYCTRGDVDKVTPLSEVEGSDFFTDTIEKALLNNEIDVAIHSAKDLPRVLPSGLKIVAVTKSINPYDALVVREDLKNCNSLEKLPKGAVIGVSGTRRRQALRKYRSDLRIADIRGNIDERLERLDRGEYDAIIVAACALIRLGLEDRITQEIPFEIVPPHPLQGCLAVETRENNFEIEKIFSVLDSK